MAKKNRILDLVNSPADLKKLNDDELGILADEIREEIVTVTSKKGGHVASSLGAVEIILAVHSLINSPRDKFIFDVGHQSYAHKLITGRRDDFSTLRDFGGMSGFPKPAESKHDVHYSGHASDSLSIALGLAKAFKLRGTKEKVVALIGDASIAGGMAFEALNQIGQEELPMVIILNENNRSIAPTVGAFKNHLNALRASSQYNSATLAVHNSLMQMGQFGRMALKLGSASKDSLKAFIYPNAIMFEEIGIKCTHAIDGHNIPELKHALRHALKTNQPTLIHVVTEKGAGYEPAYRNPAKFHGIGPYDIQTGKVKAEKCQTFTKSFSDALMYEAEHNKKIVALTAAMESGTGLSRFRHKFHKRFIDVGIAEQHLIGMAAGLAQGGMKPIVAVYSSFLQRAIDQMIVNTSLPKLDIVFCIDRAGIVGADGVTHHGIFDMAYTRMIPNMTVIAPSCSYELKSALHTAIKTGGPFAIRYPRGCAKEINSQGKVLKTFSRSIPTRFKPGTSRRLINGKDVSILAFGSCVIEAVEAAEILKSKGISARVVDMRYVKPIDKDAVADAVLETHRIVTVEDGILAGGAGQAVVDEIVKMDLYPAVKIKNLGVDDKFITHGDVKTLKEIAKIDAKSIAKAAKKLVSK